MTYQPLTITFILKLSVNMIDTMLMIYIFIKKTSTVRDFLYRLGFDCLGAWLYSWDSLWLKS